MPSARSKLSARLALLVLAAACGLWLARLDYRQKISTNVLDLIPATEQSPGVSLVRSFAGDVQARVMLFVLTLPEGSSADAAPAAREFAAALARTTEFAEAVVIGDRTAQERLGRAIYERRFELVLPGWLGDRTREFERTGQPADRFSPWLATRVAADLDAFLSDPEATAMQDLVLSDPLLLVPKLLSHAQLTAPASPDDHAAGLVWARITASPLSEEGQKPVFAAIERATADVQSKFPGATLQWTGVNRFALTSRTRIESEMRTLNLASIAGVLAVAALFVRHIPRILHLLPVILFSLAGAWTIATLAFDRLHILVFVIGSLLSGVAIDYGVYIFMQPPLRPDEPYAAKLRRLLKPLLASCLTTVLGFSLLLFSDLPMIRQIGVFVAAGLLSALAAAMLYFAQIERPFLAGRQFSGLAGHSRARWLPRALFVAAVAIALIGPWRLEWRDDIHELDLPSPALMANDAAVRAYFGENGGRSVYLTYGQDVAAARQHLADFLTHVGRTVPGATASSLGLLLPTRSDWQDLPARLRDLGGFEGDLRTALTAAGFSPDSFAPFFNSWARLRQHPPAQPYDALVASLDPLLTGPLSLLSSRGGTMSWFATLVDEPLPSAPAPELHTVGLDQLQSLNDLFTRYRWSALRLSLAGLGLVIGSVFAIYAFRRGLRIALIPAGSCFFVFGVFGLLGQPLNLFHLLGAFLGVCLSHNYAIFSSDAAGPGGAPPVSIRLSALSTATSFGVLAFSRIPVIHALGLTVCLIVLTALAVVELEPLARRKPA